MIGHRIHGRGAQRTVKMSVLHRAFAVKYHRYQNSRWHSQLLHTGN